MRDTATQSERLHRHWADVASAAAYEPQAHTDSTLWPWEIRLFGGPEDGRRRRYSSLRAMYRAHQGHWVWVPTGATDAAGRPIYHQYGCWGAWGTGVHVSAYRYVTTVARARVATKAMWPDESAPSTTQ